MSNSSRRSAIDSLDEEARALARWRAASAPPADWPEIDASLLDDVPISACHSTSGSAQSAVMRTSTPAPLTPATAASSAWAT